MRLSKIVFTLLVFFLLAGVPYTSAPQQQSKRVREAVGRCEVTRHITLEEAEQKALQDAKTEALRKAGVPEKLWTVTGLISQDDGSEFSQVLSRMTTLQVDGFINIRSVKYSEEMVDGRRYAVAVIDADVRRGGEIDPTFVLDVADVKTLYGEEERLNFTTRIYGHDAWLHIFWFDDQGGSVIYPNQYEAKKLFHKETDYRFPLNDNMEYVMSKTDKSNRFETINLIVVATKRDIPFIDRSITFESVLKWVYSIPADERAAWREAIVIQ